MATLKTPQPIEHSIIKEMSTPRQNAQIGIIPETQLAPHNASCTRLTPQDLRHPLVQSHHGPGAAVARPVLAEQAQAQVLRAVVAFLTVDTFFLFGGTVVALVSVGNVLVAPSSLNIEVRTFAGVAPVFAFILVLAYAKL